MMNYEEIYRTLLKLCENENLWLIEAELEDENIIYERRRDAIILNKRTDPVIK